jgi:hypothetical protein
VQLDVSRELHVGEVNDGELILLFISEFGSAMPSDPLEIVYGKPTEHQRGVVTDVSLDGLDQNFALKVVYGKDDTIECVLRGPGLTDQALSDLAGRVECELSSTLGKAVRREVLLSEKTVGGYFKSESFQILPAPTDAPRAQTGYLAGMNARNPCIFEFQFDSSPSDRVRSSRVFRTSRDIALTLNALLEGSIHLGRMSSRQRWVTRQPAPDNAGTIEFLFEGYGYEGFPGESDEFSPTLGLQPLAEVGAEAYYTSAPSPTDLRVPRGLAEQFNRSQTLASEDRTRWLRACYWLHHSSEAVGYSFSAAYAALVIAVDALIPENSQAHRKTEKFEDFVERHAALRGARKPLKDFYDIRSQVLHGNELLLYDRDPLPAGLTPGMNKAWCDFDDMRLLARTVLVNWLASPERTCKTN